MAAVAVFPQGYGAIITSADASGAETVQASPGAGKKLTMSTLVVNSGAAITVTVGWGESGNAVESVVVGPLSMAANSSVPIRFNPPVVSPAAKTLTVDSSGAGDVMIYASGLVVDA